MVVDCPGFTISASPVRHMIPTIGPRLKFKDSNNVLVYSCDTEPCEEVVRSSKSADVLIHESAGESYGFSSAGQAGEIDSRAEVGRLYLIHYASGKYNRGDLVHEAAGSFQGEIMLTRGFMTLDFSEKYPLSRFGRGVMDQGKGGKEAQLPSEP